MCIRDRIRRVLQILSRRTKNNPILIGEPGVGKTAIAEGLACLLYTSDAADERSSVDLGGRRIIKKKKNEAKQCGR